MTRKIGCGSGDETPLCDASTRGARSFSLRHKCAHS